MRPGSDFFFSGFQQGGIKSFILARGSENKLVFLFCYIRSKGQLLHVIRESHTATVISHTSNVSNKATLMALRTVLLGEMGPGGVALVSWVRPMMVILTVFVQ